MLVTKLPDPADSADPTSTPLSFAQEHLWLLEQLNPGRTTYHTPLALRLKGALDVAVMRAAFSRIVERHASLRTSFITIEDEPRQVIRPPAPFSLPVIDARLDADLEATVRRRATELLACPIDLERDVLLRALLVRVAETDHVLLAKIHHIASDDWSRRLLTQELSAAYAAFSKGETPVLAPLSVQYTDYARDQRERLQGPELQRQRSYWHTQLDGMQPTELSTDHARPAVFSSAAGRCQVPLGGNVVEELKSLSRVEQVTPFMLLLAAFQAVLARNCSLDDIAVGVPVSDRRTLRVEPLIGVFVNTLVMRTDASGDPTFRELVGRVRGTALEAYEHQECPFAQLVADLCPSRDLSRNPLVQIAFNLVSRRLEPLTLGDVEAVEEDWFAEQAKFDLTLYAWPHGPQPHLALVYARDLFEHARIVDLLNQFVTFLKQATADPDQRISRYSLVTRHARRLAPNSAAAALEGPIPRVSAAGKVARGALGRRDVPRSEPAVLPSRPANLEDTLKDVWQDLLNVPHVGPHDNFFELGGHSLLAAQMIIRIRKAHDVAVPLRAVFEVPTISGLAAHVRNSAAPPPEPAQERAEPATAPDGDVPPASAPLSFPQQRLWFLARLDPGSSAYHISRAFELHGRLDDSALRRALTEIVRRHTALRTTFESVAGEPRQVIQPAGEFVLRLVDVASASPADQESEVDRYTKQWVLEPFDLSRDPPIRGVLLRRGPERHLLVLTLHHIAADGWSLDILARELNELYGSACLGTVPDLPALPLQYADFALWQQRGTQGARRVQLLDYWRQELTGLPALLLPTDRARPPRLTHRGARRSFGLPAAVVESLRRIGRSENATLFMTVLASFQVLLGRHSGQADFAVGIPTANRPRREHQLLIGFFANTLAIRADLSGDPTFRELVARVRRVALGAYEHDELPFEEVVADIGAARDASRNPLVQVVFSLQHVSEPFVLPGLEVRERQIDAQRSRFDLELHLRELADGTLDGSLVYATDLFESETIDRLIDQLLTMLDGIAADPDTKLSRLSMLSSLERHRLLVEWTDTAVDYPRDGGLSSLFDARVARTPDAVAVIHGSEHVTYAELQARATRIAGHVHALGVGPGVPVALCMERGIDQVAATVAVIKAGGAYVPLDPADPPSRLAFMIADARAPVVLTSSALRDRLPEGGCAVVCLDRQVPDEADVSFPVGSGDQPAYVMYTSGSTGKPKGVMVPQRAIVRLVVNTNYVQLDDTDVVACASNPAFDAATFEVWGALLNGARLVVFDRDALLDPSLGTALGEQRVTTMFLTTALFNHVARETPGAFASVRNLLIGGEAADPTAVGRVLAAGKPARLINAYGPTESTTFATFHEVQTCDAADKTVPIGRPLANTTTYVLDEFGEPAPVGVPGELHIGGDGLALGYLNQPALTAERFIPHPFVSGERLYWTGDRARWRSDGRLEFLGRRDDQVKLRGYRIEPGEIEAELAGHPTVSSCAVAAIGEGGEKRLVAYVVARHGHRVESRALGHHLRARLPDHMVPVAFVSLAALPLTRNGKIDRRALPAPDLAKPARPDRLRQPATDTETRLARIWREALETPEVGVDDNFFEIGGHSLLAVRLVALIEKEFGVELPLSQLFEHGTIASLALVLDGSRQVTPWSPLVPIRPAGSEKPLFLVHGVGGEVLTFTNLALRLPAEWPVYGIQAAGPGAGHQMPSEIPALAERYADVISSAEPEGPYYLGGFSSGAVTALEIARVLRRRGKCVALLLAIDGGLPPTVKPRQRVRHTPASILRQMAFWVVDDALATSAEEWWPRINSKGRSLVAKLRSSLRVRSTNGRDSGDVRHHLGMWKFPEQYRNLLQDRFEAFQRYTPKPFDGEIALIRSRTGRLFGPRPENLDEAWRTLAQGTFSRTYVRASHNSLLAASRVGEVAKAIAGYLEGARAVQRSKADR